MLHNFTNLKLLTYAAGMSENIMLSYKNALGTKDPLRESNIPMYIIVELRYLSGMSI